MWAMKLLIVMVIASATFAQDKYDPQFVKYTPGPLFHVDHVYEAWLDSPVTAWLLPDKDKRGEMDKSVLPPYRHWVIELRKGMTIRQAFAALDDLGCGDKPKWTLEHLVHAIERQFVGTGVLKPESRAVLVYR